MPTFLEYYKSKSKAEKTKINRRIYAETEIPYSTLYRKLREGGWSKLERKCISNILGFSENELFPD
jgi:hypothetical protein